MLAAAGQVQACDRHARKGLEALICQTASGKVEACEWETMEEFQAMAIDAAEGLQGEFCKEGQSYELAEVIVGDGVGAFEAAVTETEAGQGQGEASEDFQALVCCDCVNPKQVEGGQRNPAQVL